MTIFTYNKTFYLFTFYEQKVGNIVMQTAIIGRTVKTRSGKTDDNQNMNDLQIFLILLHPFYANFLNEYQNIKCGRKRITEEKEQ